ncbi:MFS transporter [Novosphingobium aquae]|uniref:MFS transporter n=1 Tax=Novosphingobium aquae TaxID=3133435 RepID=A0ABU8SCR3_9SPHN
MDEGLAPRRRLMAAICVSAGSILYTLDANIPNVALPTIAGALGIARGEAVLLVSSYNLILAMALLPLAAAGDRLGHRRIFVAGFSIYMLAAIGSLFANGLPFLIGIRVVQALAASALLSVSLAMVRFIYPAQMLGRGMGLNTMMASLGAALAPGICGLLLSHFDWRAIFAAGLPLAVAGLAFARALPDPEVSAAPFDKKGAMLCAATLGTLIVGLQGMGTGMPHTVALGLLAAGLLLGAIFVRFETRLARPVLPIDLLKDPALALSVGGALLAVLASTLALLYLPFELHEAGMSPAAVGAALTPYAFAVIIIAPSSGMLSDRFSPQWLGLWGLMLALAGLVALAFIPDHPQVMDVAWRVALCGAGFSLFFSPNGRLMISSVPRSRTAGASSLLATTRMFGQALGSALLGSMVAAQLGAAPMLIACALGGLALLATAIRLALPPPSAELRQPV